MPPPAAISPARGAGARCYAGYGVGDELGCVATDDRGSWGDFRLYRNSDDAPFDADDARLMRDVSALLARGLRRAAVAPIDAADGATSEMGVLLLDGCLQPCGATESARVWFRALNPADTPFPDGIPASSGTSSGGSSPPSAARIPAGRRGCALAPAAGAGR